MASRLIHDHNKNNKVDNIFYMVDNSVNMFTNKIEIYNPNAGETLQKFWIHIDKAKLVRKRKNRVKIAVFNKDANLISFMKSLDKRINEKVEGIDSGITDHGSSVEISESYPPVMELDVDEVSRIFDADNNKVNFINIANGSNISLYIELEGVYLDKVSDAKNWRILQMKENSIINLDVSLFDDPNLSKQPVNSVQLINTNIPPAPQMHNPHMHMGYGAPPQPMGYGVPPPPMGMPHGMPPGPPMPPPAPSFNPMAGPAKIKYTKPKIKPRPKEAAPVSSGRSVPTAAELMGALKNLKKVVKNKVNKKKDNKVTEELEQNTVKLKKVVTKEPIGMVEIMKREHREKRHREFIEKALSGEKRYDINNFSERLESYRKSFEKDKIGKRYKKLLKKIKKVTNLKGNYQTLRIV